MKARALVLAALLPALLGAERPSGLGDVRDVRFWSYPDYTRVVIETTTPVAGELEVRRLGADPKSGRPQRLYVDLPKIWVGRRYDEGVVVHDGLLEGVRLGQNTLRQTRVVLDLEHYERHRLLVLRSPHRLVIDVYGERADEKSLRWPARQPGVGAPFSRLPPAARRVETVVLDPGHGGRDPGAIGVGGLREKDVNLRLAQRLRPLLEHRGFDVVLTRDDDRTLSLEERTALAESARGDLFVSLHANASPRRGTRGFEIYTLDESHERHSLRVAARENGVPQSEMDTLQRALARLRISELSHYASRLAGFVHEEVVGGVPGFHTGFHDLGVKKGPFYVLFLSSMPSILIESGFVTNGSDAQMLRDERFLEAMAEGIADGLTRYRERPVDLVASPVP